MMKHVMSVRKGASLHILTRQTNMYTLFQQGTECHGFTHSPINLSLIYHFQASLQNTLHGAMDLKVRCIGGSLREPLANVSESLLMYSSVLNLQRVLTLEESRPGRVKPMFVEDLSLLSDFLIFINDCTYLFFCDNSLIYQFFRVNFENIFVFLDYRVHNWLSKHGLINLVVTMLPVSNQVDDNILVPGGSPFSSYVGHQHNSLGVISVDVENWSVDDPADICAVRRGSGVSGISCESDLVVGNNMNCSPGCIIRQFSHVHCLVHNTLTSKSCVTVQ